MEEQWWKTPEFEPKIQMPTQIHAGTTALLSGRPWRDARIYRHLADSGTATNTWR
jgi:hypothetical protein